MSPLKKWQQANSHFSFISGGSFNKKDTGLNIGSNDVTIDIEVDPDKLSL